MVLQLRNADFSTAVRIADAINTYSRERFGKRVAQEQDSRTVNIRKPDGISPARFYAEIENIVVEADAPARVVIDERTGTIVIGNDVRISRVAISHGALTVRITEAPKVVQPEPFSKGEDRDRALYGNRRQPAGCEGRRARWTRPRNAGFRPQPARRQA